MRVDELTGPRVEVLQGSCDMARPSSSERPTPVRRDNDRESARDGIGVDDKGEYKPVREGEYQGESVRACVFFARGLSLRLLLTIARLL